MATHADTFASSIVIGGEDLNQWLSPIQHKQIRVHQRMTNHVSLFTSGDTGRNVYVANAYTYLTVEEMSLIKNDCQSQSIFFITEI